MKTGGVVEVLHCTLGVTIDKLVKIHFENLRVH